MSQSRLVALLGVVSVVLICAQGWGQNAVGASPIVAAASPTSAVSTTLPEPPTAPAARDPEIAELRKKLAESENRFATFEKVASWRNDTITQLLTLIAILLGAVGLVFPIYTYFTSIRPSDEATKAARAALDGLERRFDELSQRHRETQVAKAIENLSSVDEKVRQAAENQLALDPYYAFTKSQLIDMCDAAAVQGDGPLRAAVLTVIANHQSPHVLRTLRDVFERSNEGQKVQVFGYLAQYARQTKDPEGENAVLSALAKAPEQYFTMFLSSLSSDPALLSRAINDERLFTQFNVQTLLNARTLLNAFKIAGLDIEGSALTAALAGERPYFIDKSGHPTEPSNAEFALIYTDGKHSGTIVRGSQAFAALLTPKKV